MTFSTTDQMLIESRGGRSKQRRLKDVWRKLRMKLSMKQAAQVFAFTEEGERICMLKVGNGPSGWGIYTRGFLELGGQKLCLLPFYGAHPRMRQAEGCS